MKTKEIKIRLENLLAELERSKATTTEMWEAEKPKAFIIGYQEGAIKNAICTISYIIKN